jgi:glycosyltransferase involved in cell wall biosynthesis
MQSMDWTSTSRVNRRSSDEHRQPPVSARGKFLFRGDQKFFIKGVTYGPFAPDADGTEYRRDKVETDFRQMAENGFNSIRTYTVPPLWLLDTAQDHGLHVMVGIPWEQHIAFLDDPARVTAIKESVVRSVRQCEAHPAILCYAIGNEVPSPIVRWHGAARVEAFLHELYQSVKAIDPNRLVTYVNYPSTEYLQLPFLDFFCFNVYLEQEEKLKKYLSRLHNLAGDVPVVLAEIGLDSLRNGDGKQAETLGWQIARVFDSGSAGTYVFSWTDEWHRGGNEIEDWDFGLTRRDRSPKPALTAVAEAFRNPIFRADITYPKISVVVCSYNGGSVIRDCMEGLMQIDYPDFEVIVIDDGSKDNTAAVVSEYPFKLIRTENRGLSNARNTGLELATGEIVAYTDDDARPDPHWLYYLAQTYMSTDFVAVGGPNIAPEGDGWIAECVANAPGGPVHVLIDDVVAEHIPGCNCSFRADALRSIGGWDPRFRSAGDDVDVCWRLQDMGWKIGFNPAAMVWHHRRNSVKAYWKQQIGYGKAESLLEEKWADKYNPMGHLQWTGRLYGKGLTQAIVSFYERVYTGRWGTAPFQSLYQRSPNTLWSLPLMPEWYLVILILALLCVVGVFWTPLLVTSVVLAAVAIGLVVVQAAMSASKALFPQQHKRDDLPKLYVMTAVLHMLQPMARLTGRLRHGLTPWRRRGSPHSVVPVPREKVLWSERWYPLETVLKGLSVTLKEDGAIVDCGGDFDRWDLQVRGGLLASARIFSTVEEHGAGKQLFRFRLVPQISTKAVLLLGLLVALAIESACEYYFFGGSVIVASVVLMAMAIWLASLIYRECSAPFAASLSALEAINRRFAAEAQTDAGALEDATKLRTDKAEAAGTY